MTRAYAEAPATHYRLTAETWAIIAEEYKNGATAKELGAKWKVAPSSVYRYACRDGFTKKSMGDARARAHARMVEEEEGAARALKPTGSRALAGLFAPAPVGNDQAGDAGELARAATLASGRAMHGRLWAEAKALAGLAETYARLAERGDPRRGGMTVDNMPLDLKLAVLLDENECERFSLIGSEPGRDPDHEIKQRYWERRKPSTARWARSPTCITASCSGCGGGRRRWSASCGGWGTNRCPSRPTATPARAGTNRRPRRRSGRTPPCSAR